MQHLKTIVKPPCRHVEEWTTAQTIAWREVKNILSWQKNIMNMKCSVWNAGHKIPKCFTIEKQQKLCIIKHHSIAVFGRPTEMNKNKHACMLDSLILAERFLVPAYNRSGFEALGLNGNTPEMFPVAGKPRWNPKKELCILCKHGYGSCSFFASVAFREPSYLADDECLGTSSCLTSGVAFKPWQPAQPQPHNPGSPTWAFSATNQKAPHSGQRLLPTAVTYANGLLRNMCGVMCCWCVLTGETFMTVQCPRDHHGGSSREACVCFWEIE